MPAERAFEAGVIPILIIEISQLLVSMLMDVVQQHRLCILQALLSHMGLIFQSLCWSHNAAIGSHSGPNHRRMPTMTFGGAKYVPTQATSNPFSLV